MQTQTALLSAQLSEARNSTIMEDEEDKAPEHDIEPQHAQPAQPVLHPPDPLPHQPDAQLDNNLLLIGPVIRSRAQNLKK